MASRVRSGVRLGSWLGLLVFGWCVWACNTAAPHLLSLQSVHPHALQARDVLELAGDGFVAGAEGRLTLEGTLYRPGQPPQEVRAQLGVQGINATRAEARLPDDVVERWCTTEEDGLVHATFRGRLRLAFRPRTLGAPPLIGELDQVVLEVYPEFGVPAAALASRVEALQQELGWTLREATAGVVVEQVEPQGRAYEAGLRQGDRLLEFAGVTVTDPSDLAPYSGQREARVRIRHVRGGEPQDLTLDVTGVFPLTAAAWKWGWVLVGVVVGLIVSSRSPLGYLLAWLESQAAVRPGPTRLSLPRLGGLQRRSRRRLPRGFSAFLGVSLLFAGLAWRLYPLELDLLWVFLGGVVLRCLAGLLSGGLGVRWSLWRGLWAVVRQLPVVVATASCLAATLIERGSLQLTDVARRGSSEPAIHLFASLPEYFSGLALLACALILALRQEVRRANSSARARLAAALARWLEDAHLLIVGGLFAVLFLGGWGMSAPLEGGSKLPSLTDLLVFEAKLVTWYVLLVWLRGRPAHLPHATANALILRYFVPISLGALLLVPVWSAPAWPPWLREATMAIAGAVTLLWIALALGRWSYVRCKQEQLTAINPWL